MSIVEKKISELTAADHKEALRPIGTPDMPYPGIYSELDSDGKIVKQELGVIADPSSQLALYSDQSPEFVTGLMFRNMASPSLLYAQQEVIRLMAPDSKNRFVVLLGEAGNGKTELAKTIAWASDSRGPLMVDCGGRYLSDLIWEKVIDFGDGFKQALTDRIRNGTLSAKSIEIFDQSLPDALVRENGKITDINWDKIGEPKNKGTEKDPDIESTAEACDRDLKFIQTISTLEGIPPQSTNSIGVKKQRGIMIRAWESGQKLILDEMTKSKIDGDNAMQTMFQFLNGEIDKVTLQNDMKVAGHPETDDITLQHSDMKVGFGVIATGNEESDGSSTHGFSVSQNSRFTKFISGKPTSDDWKHQITREMTGMPFSTINKMLPGAGKNDPEGFGDALVQTCQMGLSEQDRAKITPEKLTHLKNWDRTHQAVDMMTQYYMFFQQLVDPTSELNSRGLDKAHPDYEIMQNLKADISKEARTSMSFRDQCAIDPRKIIQDVTNALAIKPTVQQIGENPGLCLNPAAVGHRDLTPPVNNPEEISAEFGTRMAQVLQARVGSMMVGREALNAALVAKMKQIGIIPSDDHDGPTLADLLNQPLIQGLGSQRNAFYFRKTLVEHLKGANSNLTDDEVISQDQAADVYKELEKLTAGSAETSPREASVIVLGQDLSHIFNQASAVDSIGDKNQPAPADLIPAAAFIESLKVPALAEWNTQAIFRKTVSAENLIPASDVTTPVVQMAEYNGSIGITTLRMQGANGDAVPVNIIRDGERGQSLIVTDAADSMTKDALRRDGYTVVAYGASDAEMRVADFIRATLELPSRKAALTDTERHLTAAFLLRAGDAKNEAELQPLKELMTTKSLPAPAAVNMLNKPL